MWASSASRLCECWLPEERPAPNCVRTVRAISAAPPVMKGSLAAWLSSWSRQTPRKSRYITSTTGRMPGHGRTDGEPDDRRLRDRRVADPVAEALAQPAGQAEHVAALADVDAGQEHALVGLQLGLRARCGWRPWCGRPAASAGSAGGFGSRGRRSRPTKSNSVRRRRRGQTARPLDGLVELGRHGGLERVDLGLARRRHRRAGPVHARVDRAACHSCSSSSDR